MGSRGGARSLLNSSALRNARGVPRKMGERLSLCFQVGSFNSTQPVAVGFVCYSNQLPQSLQDGSSGSSLIRTPGVLMWPSTMKRPLPPSVWTLSLISSGHQSLFSPNSSISEPSLACANLQDGDGEKHFLPHASVCCALLNSVGGKISEP